MATRRKSKKPKLDDLVGIEEPKAPLDGTVLLAAAKPVLKALEDDLLERATKSASVTVALEQRHAREREEERTAEDLGEWRRSFVTQVSAAWFLSCVFVRTLEDRGLFNAARIAGPGASDSQKLFFEMAPSLTERDYLLTIFRELCRFPAARALFDEKHNPVWLLAPSAEAAKSLLRLFRTPSAEAPAFRFGGSDTRFLGDLYQDLSEEVRKKYALLQTPRFVERFILDQTLEPAIEKFGLDETTLIDPTCGSGHFLLGAFERLFEHRLEKEPGIDLRVAAAKALDAVYGADINPYAVAIARMRLTLAFLEKAGFSKLSAAPQLPLHLVVADSLLHNPHHAQGEFQNLPSQSAERWGGEMYALEDEAAARSVLHRRYAAVVGNPPYITVKDAVLRERYRQVYISAAGKYSLSAPFCERFFQLGRDRAFVGMITANSFMKREFGKALIQEFLPTVNLTSIVNTSGAYIPGHATPTVLLFGANDPPNGEVHTVLASRGEPATPNDPEQGLVWRSIADHGSEVGFENEYITVARVERGALTQHPWSLGGGGASDLKELLEERAEKRLGDIATAIGFDAIMGEDELFVGDHDWIGRLGLHASHVRDFTAGEVVRDWSIYCQNRVIFPYDSELEAELPDESINARVHFWKYRTNLINRQQFGKNTIEAGLKWFEYRSFYKSKRSTPLSIAFAEVATHNHFVLDYGGKVFNRTAPIIKLPETATDDDHLALLAYLNSSTACFCMKQVAHIKQMTAHDSVRITELAKVPRQFSGGSLETVSIPPRFDEFRDQFAYYGRRLTELAEEYLRYSPENAVPLQPSDIEEIQSALDAARRSRTSIERKLIALQEELDWFTYGAFELRSGDVPRMPSEMAAGQRPFELAQRVFEARTTTIDDFEIPEIESVYHAKIAKACIKETEASRWLKILEVHDFKRRWVGKQGKFNRLANTYDESFADAVEARLATLIEVCVNQAQTQTTSEILSKLSSAARAFAAYLYEREEPLGAGSVSGLLHTQAIPFLAAYRYSDAGLETRRTWEHVWAQQRAEDLGKELEISIPPRYSNKDFRRAEFWPLRGKLDVPQERFISYPGCESEEDGEPIYGWAGWNHLQRAQALAALYQHRKTEEGWGADRLTPILAGILELTPWVKQWHNEPSEEFGGLELGDYFESFVDAECKAYGLTRDDLIAWRPPEKKKSTAKRKRAAPKNGAPEAEEAPKKKRAPRKRKKAGEAEAS